MSFEVERFRFGIRRRFPVRIRTAACTIRARILKHVQNEFGMMDLMIENGGQAVISIALLFFASKLVIARLMSQKNL